MSKNPMQYFVESDAKSKTKKLPTIASRIEAHQKKIHDQINDIIGQKDLKKYLREITEKKKFSDFRLKHSLSAKSSLADVVILVGSGDHHEVARSFMHYYATAEITKEKRLYKTNINDYTHDPQKRFKELFSTAEGCTIYLTEFEKLFVKSDYDFVDWYQWMFDTLYDRIQKKNRKTQILFSMSHKMYERFLSLMPQFVKLKCDVVQCYRYTADEMAELLQKRMMNDGYKIWRGVDETLKEQFAQIVKNEKKMSEESAINTMFEKVLNNQTARLSQVPITNISKRRLRNILKVDIPLLSIPVDQDNVIYL